MMTTYADGYAGGQLVAREYVLSLGKIPKKSTDNATVQVELARNILSCYRHRDYCNCPNCVRQLYIIGFYEGVLRGWEP